MSIHRQLAMACHGSGSSPLPPVTLPFTLISLLSYHYTTTHLQLTTLLHLSRIATHDKWQPLKAATDGQRPSATIGSPHKDPLSPIEACTNPLSPTPNRHKTIAHRLRRTAMPKCFHGRRPPNGGRVTNASTKNPPTTSLTFALTLPIHRTLALS